MILALNNKCNLDKDEFIKYLNELNTIETTSTLILCPSTINIPMFDSKKILLGAQNVSKAEQGPHTGDVNAKQLSSYNVKYCIVGHSERRTEHNETNKEINKKIKRLQREKIIPILCIGETLEERRNKTYKRVISKQIREGLINIGNIDDIIIAYEPVYSIGTGLTPTKEEIVEIVKLIKKKLPNNKILYGGSVNNSNKDMLSRIDLDGYLVGNLGLRIEDLKEFLK